jgi:hypothetical protein
VAMEKALLKEQDATALAGARSGPSSVLKARSETSSSSQE